jgi:NADH-quinone oxidoreductase subunit D
MSHEKITNGLQGLIDRAAESFGTLVLELQPGNLVALVKRLKDGFGFDLVLDVTAVDYPERNLRFDVVYHFSGSTHNDRVRLKVQVPDKTPFVPTLTPLYGSARYLEREAHEMYGINFTGNNDLRPILLYEGFVGHPLRKDYPIDMEQPIVPYRHNGASQAKFGPPVSSPLQQSADPNNVVVNIGPSHPATHGTIQIIAELDGETVKKADVHCGYLHRGFEKEAEHHTYHKVIPYTDRLNYCSALNNNFAYAEAVESLLGIEITPRCKWLRTLLAEYNRVADHVTCVAATVMEMGAMTAFLYLMTVRDYIFEHLNWLTGARLTYSYVRIGGLARDIPDGWLDRLEEILQFTERYCERIHGLLDRNRIFIDRTRNVAAMTSAHALNWGYTGPILRSTGLARDIRKDHPYLAYPELDFDIPVGIKGDNYDRYYVRMREIDESISMVRQCVKKLPGGPVSVNDPRVTLPEKELVYTQIQPLINHFKLIMEGIQVPPGEIYTAHEAPNGELGFYLVSTGGGHAYRLHVRSPSFAHMGGMHTLLEGYQVADIIATFGSMNMIGGECDR